LDDGSDDDADDNDDDNDNDVCDDGGDKVLCWLEVDERLSSVVDDGMPDEALDAIDDVVDGLFEPAVAAGDGAIGVGAPPVIVVVDGGVPGLDVDGFEVVGKGVGGTAVLVGATGVGDEDGEGIGVGGIGVSGIGLSLTKKDQWMVE
jgi:hypothetical protein